MPINKNKLTKEIITKAMQCETEEELMALAKSEGFDISKEEAEAYMSELADVELDGKELRSVAGGVCWTDCGAQCRQDGCSYHCRPPW